MHFYSVVLYSSRQTSILSLAVFGFSTAIHRHVAESLTAVRALKPGMLGSDISSDAYTISAVGWASGVLEGPALTTRLALGAKRHSPFAIEQSTAYSCSYNRDLAASCVRLGRDHTKCEGRQVDCTDSSALAASAASLPVLTCAHMISKLRTNIHIRQDLDPFTCVQVRCGPDAEQLASFSANVCSRAGLVGALQPLRTHPTSRSDHSAQTHPHR